MNVELYFTLPCNPRILLNIVRSHGACILLYRVLIVTNFIIAGMEVLKAYLSFAISRTSSNVKPQFSSLCKFPVCTRLL